MEEIEKIPYLEVFKICKEYLENPQQDAAFNSLKKSLKIREYLPMQEKIITLYRVIEDSDKPMDLGGAVFTTALDIAMTFNGLLAYTNIDTFIPFEGKVYETYDLIYQSGLADYILQYCFKDYDRLYRMMERSISYENMKELIETLNQIDTQDMQKALGEFRDFRDHADPQIIKDLADIIRFNDPTLYQVKDGLIDDALSKLETADKLEKIELENLSDSDE